MGCGAGGGGGDEEVGPPEEGEGARAPGGEREGPPAGEGGGLAWAECGGKAVACGDATVGEDWMREETDEPSGTLVGGGTLARVGPEGFGAAGGVVGTVGKWGRMKAGMVKCDAWSAGEAGVDGEAG